MPTTLKDIGEFGFIEKISRGCLIRPEGIVRAIGDDAAAFRVPDDMVTLVTTDLLVERIHFLREAGTGFDLGHKALAVNLSDIAAMGGTALEAFVSLAIPDTCDLEYLETIYDGMRNLATPHRVNILGGDTTRAKRDLVLSLTLVGGVAPKELLGRDTAQAGDLIYSTGTVGESGAGLYLILNKIHRDEAYLNHLLTAHLLPRPHLEEGRFLAQFTGVHSAIDVSDGLSSDIGHIAEASGVGVRLWADKIPISDALRSFCSRFDLDPVEFALSGGEDYTLLCTVDPRQGTAVEAGFKQRFGNPLFAIGEVTRERSQILVLPDGRTRSFTGTGWNHFKKE